MFTGIIEEVGTVESIEPRSPGARIRVACNLVAAGAFEGSSIAVNGVCLTAIGIRPGGFAADLAPETLSRTNLGDARPGDLLNLERPLLAAGRLSGHVVQGHVDGTGSLRSLETLGDGNWWLDVEIPGDLDRYVVHKGSIAIDGISLTVARISGGVAGVAIVPHTYSHTNLIARRPGMKLNLECDVIAKYVEKMMAGKPRAG